MKKPPPYRKKIRKLPKKRNYLKYKTWKKYLDKTQLLNFLKSFYFALTIMKTYHKMKLTLK